MQYKSASESQKYHKRKHTTDQLITTADQRRLTGSGSALEACLPRKGKGAYSSS